MPTKLLTLTLAAILALAGLACSDDDNDGESNAEETVESVADDAQEEAEDAATTVADAADEAALDAAEATARTIGAEQGAEEFADNDAELDGDLTCEATGGESDPDQIILMCTGTTMDGGEAELSGNTSELPGASATELEGDFTGTVDGDEVFTTDRLGGSDDGS